MLQSGYLGVIDGAERYSLGLLVHRANQWGPCAAYVYEAPKYSFRFPLVFAFPIEWDFRKAAFSFGLSESSRPKLMNQTEHAWQQQWSLWDVTARFRSFEPVSFNEPRFISPEFAA